jgi:hypothetical protein
MSLGQSPVARIPNLRSFGAVSFYMFYFGRQALIDIHSKAGWYFSLKRPLGICGLKTGPAQMNNSNLSNYL